MRLRLNAPRRQVLSLTPLIDVVFLLLVFFILASTFVRFSTVKIETAVTGGGQVDLKKTTLIHIGKDNALRLNGRPVPREQIPNDLAQQISDGKTDAVVVVRKEAQVSDLVRALAQIRAAGFASVRVVD